MGSWPTTHPTSCYSMSSHLRFNLGGGDAYRKSWEQFFPWFGDSGVFEISELSITVGDDVAFCHRPYPLWWNEDERRQS
jgi:ketosteroid isomerase-like protein